MEKYGYDIDTKTMTCRTCRGTLYEVPRSNLHKYRCWLCNGRGAEVDLLRHLHVLFANNPEVGGYVTRTARYPKQGNHKIRTADAKVVVNGEEWLIEVDESSHLWGINHVAHRHKDLAVIYNGLRLIRVYANDDIATACEEIYRITTGALFDDDEDDVVAGDEFIVYPHALRTRPAARAFFRKLYELDGHNIPRFYRNLEAAAEPEPEPIAEQEPEPEAEAEQEAELAAEQEAELAAEPELKLLEEPRAEPLEISAELEVTIASLREEFVSRFEELCAYYRDVEEREDSKQKDDMIGQLVELIGTGTKIAMLCDNVADNDEKVVSVIKKWLYAATSTLLFNGRAVNTTANQRIEETEEKVEQNIPAEAPAEEPVLEIPKISGGLLRF